MRSKKKGLKKVLAEFLCVALIACSMPGAAFAAEEDNTGKGSVTADYDTDGQKDTSSTETKESADTGTDEKDSSRTNEQGKGEGNTKDSDGTTGTDGESSEGKDEESGTETKESDSEKTGSGSEDGDEESTDTEQNTSDAEDEGGSDGESAKEDDAEADSEDDTDTDSDKAEDDTDDEADAEDDDESDVTDKAKGGSAASDDEEEEDEEEEEDWIDGPLDDDLMLLTASPSDAILLLDDPIDGVWQIEREDKTYLAFADALEAAKADDTIILLDDIEENITVTSGSVVTLDLNDHTLSAEYKNNSVVIIEEDAKLTLMDSGDDGCITGSESNGGGVYNAGIFNMDSGTISGNFCERGGGVYNTGTFNMNDGLISDNGASDGGGGVYNTGTFNMYGGTISENNFIMESNEGGGVWNSGTFNMTDGEISGNEAMNGAGGVHTYYNGTFTMTGGTISENSGAYYGGGVGVVYGSTFIMEDGAITENIGVNGGGVCISAGNFTMTGGTISGNTAYDTGDGIIAINSVTFNLSGSPVITGNGTSNVYLNGDYITLAGDLEEGASIGVTPKTVPAEGNPVQITATESGTEYYKESAQYFFYDGDSSYVGTPNEEGQYVEIAKEHVASLTQNGTTTEYTSVQAAVEAAGSTAGTVTMLADSTENVTIASGQDITLDLAGCTLDGNKAGSVITNNGTLTLKDSVGSGCITNGNASHGGGVYNSSNCTFNMDGGTISGNTASYEGGGVSNYGTFNMIDGTISGNTAGYGGGVYDCSTFNMTGGTISENTASTSYGGGVYAQSSFTMTDGTISGNTASSYGGGVYASGYFTMEGGTISGNKASSEGGGVYANGGARLYKGTISENSATNGGGIYTPDMKLYGGSVTGNEATNGGGIYASNGFNMEGGTISGNTASSQGGGVYISTASVKMSAGMVTGNTADNGGGLYVSSGSVDMSSGSIYGNIANTAAADIYDRTSLALNVIPASEMEADGYTVLGWFDDSAGARYADTDEPQECDTSTAGYHYVIAAYGSTVTYSVNGDTDVIEGTFIDITKGQTEAALASGDELTVPDGYCSFDNWNTEEDGSGTAYAGGAEYSGESVTLYAQFAGHDWEVEQTVIENSEDRYEEMVGIKCRRCGLEYEEEIVVSTESSGVTVHSSLSWSDFLTEDDLADLFETGAELDFKMTAAALSESDVPSADRTLAEDLIASQWPDADYTASWLDISVLLDIIHSTGEEETREYSSTLNPITITVAIPDDLLNADGDTYAVIRIHEGEATVLDTTDNGDGTLTFESDLFSTYVIVKTAGADSGNGGSGSGRSNSSNGRSSGSSGTGSIAYSTGTWTIDEFGHWRYTDSNGRRYENEWGYIYNPYADTSAGQPSASWFHFGYDGIMDTGWYIDTDGKMYYLNPSLDNTQGAMFTGWVFIDGKWYYFDASGALLRNTQTPDGYTVDETGARVLG